MKVVTFLILLLVCVSPVLGLEAVVNPSNPSDVVLNSSNNWEVNKTFDASASSDVKSYSWNLLDTSSKDSGPIGEFSFDRDKNAVNTLRLTVSNGTSSDVEEVTQVLHDQPNASIDASSTDVEIESSVDFTSKTVNVFDGELNYSWTINNTEESTSSSFSYIFDNEGLYTVKLKVEDAEGYSYTTSPVSIDVTNTSTSSSDQQSGSGGSVSDVESEVEEFSSINEGDKVELDLSDQVIHGMSDIAFFSDDDAEQVEIELRETDSLPDELPENFKVYRSTEVELYNFSNSDIDGDVNMTFEVENDWIEENRINISTLEVYRNDGDWERLESSIDNSSDTIIVNAESPGFSYFAIGGEEKENQTAQDNMAQDQDQQETPSTTSTENQDPLCGDGVCEPGETCRKDCVELQKESTSSPGNQTSNNDEKNDETASKLPVVPVVGLLLVAGLVGGLALKRDEIESFVHQIGEDNRREIEERLDKINDEVEEMKENGENPGRGVLAEIDRAEEYIDYQDYESALDIIEGIERELGSKSEKE